ncbi:prenyltransferase [Allofournierella sp.]|uniref:prenyltransferase n=1 Tax=Allofournierella sp. TaxID=1940256 RepID=UPI003AEF71B5
MGIKERYAADIAAILARQGDNGGALWATADRRLLKGAPFSTLECVDYLLELGLSPADLPLPTAAQLILGAWRPDGRFRVYPQGAIYPCQTIWAALTLCRLGYAGDERLQATFRQLLADRWADGGWRCNKFSYGRGPETEASNPHPTLLALDLFRYASGSAQENALDDAVEFLLAHWVTRKPLGPCHYGIGSLFMQVEYPFRNYNLFYYVYVLSFYEKARRDERFIQAFEALRAKTRRGQIVVERVVPKLAKLEFCKKGEPSELATRRYREILQNLGLEK